MSVGNRKGKEIQSDEEDAGGADRFGRRRGSLFAGTSDESLPENRNMDEKSAEKTREPKKRGLGKGAGETITCRLGEEAADAAFCAEHRHLYHRICRLADNVAGYFLRGDAHILIVSGAPREGVPRFVAVTFDARADRVYEAQTERAIAKNRFARELPKPKFAVRLETEFADGGRETFVFDFGAYSEPAIEAFCEQVCTCARMRFRHRFSPRD